MSLNGGGKPGKPLKSESSTQTSTIPSKADAPAPSPAPRSTTPPPPPPVIPSSWLLPHEQRRFFLAIFGLIELTKIWDILAPYFINPEPTWSSALRLQGPITALLWTAFELSTIFLISLLRIPLLSPSLPQLLKILLLLFAYNLACWIVAEPGSFWVRVNVFGPPALGVQWYLAWWPLMRSIVWKESAHISGIHHIRLLPYSTATLNPLSLTYCIPPDSHQTIYIPVVFNNSAPEEISYYVQSLDTGHKDIRTIAGSAMKRSTNANAKSRLEITEGDEDNDSDPEFDPLSALVLHSSQSQELDVAKLPSVKPSDSLALVPKHLEPTQDILFLTADKPSIIMLKNVIDKRGDRFHIAPHREAVIVECPTGGHFVEDHQDRIVQKGDKPQPAELRCVGEEEVAKFQARGVAPLQVGWRKKSKDASETGVIEGIEDEIDLAEQETDYRHRVSKTHTVPLRLTHGRPGVYTVSLTGVTDSLHNTYTPSGHSAEKVFNVIARSSARFDCSAPIQLLKDRTATLPVLLDGSGQLPPSLEVQYGHTSPEGRTITKSLKMTKRVEHVVVSEPGTYTLLDIQGPCAGSVMEPSTCVVQMVPLPTVDMTVTTLHECAMDVGVTAAFEFTGTPSFVVEWSEQRKGGKAVTRSKRFDGYVGEIVLLPDQEGQYTYSFNSLSDRSYSRIKLDKPPIKQTVHPLANVEVVGRADGPKRLRLYACSGDEVDVYVEAKGAAPLRLSYLKSWDHQAENVTVDIPSGRSKVTVPVPPALASDSGASGKLSIVLLSIEDGNGCVRKLPAPTVEVDINRQKPTVRFSKSDRVIITEGEVARAPLRLTGTGPWEVHYTLNSGKERKVTLRDPNNHLSLEGKGVYRLTKVKDANCPGIVLEAASTYEVEFKPRPEVSLIQSPAVIGEQDVYRHKGLCAGEEDHVGLRFNGQAPFDLDYKYTREGHSGKHTLKSAQDVGVLHLAMDPGRHRYEFTDLKDSNYAHTKVSFSLEHEVHSRPSISFVRPNSKPICLDSPLHSEARVRTQGKAPFSVTFSVRKPASASTSLYTLSLDSPEWTLDLPQHLLSEIGRHEVTIAAMSDASGCKWEVNELDRLSTVVEVVESARIVPVNQDEDLCVGDRLDFLLQGKAPWSIEYEWLGKTYRDTSSASRFSRVAEKKGTFSIKSVALKDNQCKREINDLVRRVHPLPSVRIQEGLDHLREGDDPAAFKVTFTGTAPFSFTYIRSEMVSGKNRVVETQTVEGIWKDSYTISSSQPGDYEVISVADKYCRYPPLRGSSDS